jgi:hypothetical protein
MFQLLLGTTVYNVSDNQTYYPLFTNLSSGTLTYANVNSSTLTFNPSTGTVTSTLFTATSDETLKENIQPLVNSLDVVKQIEGVSFDWKENGNKSYGVIAQQIETVLPDVVITNNEGVKSVNYQALTAFLIESIKQLSSEIEELKKQK